MMSYLLPENFDRALMGTVQQGPNDPVAVYNRDICIEVLVEGGLSQEAAEEDFEYNIQGAWLGDGTPFFFVPADENEKLTCALEGGAGTYKNKISTTHKGTPPPPAQARESFNSPESLQLSAYTNGCIGRQGVPWPVKKGDCAAVDVN